MPRPDGWAPPTQATVQGLDASTRVKCICGRTVIAGMMYDLDPVPPAKRPRLLSRAGRSSRYVCDACREMLFRDERLPKNAYLRYLNAPADLIEKAEGDPNWKNEA